MGSITVIGFRSYTDVSVPSNIADADAGITNSIFRREYVNMQQSIAGNNLCSGLVGKSSSHLEKLTFFSNFIIFADDAVTPQWKESGFMKALLEAGGVRSMFVGHDHGNSWCCPYKGIEICYNRHTGYGGYGEWTRGARVIDLDINNLGSQKNYVRLETGEVTDEFPPKH